MIIEAVEGALPDKFCWKVVAPDRICKDSNYEWHFTSCKLKCNEGYERFGFHCRKACLAKEMAE